MVHGGGQHHHSQSSSRDNDDGAFQSGSHGVGRHHPAAGHERRMNTNRASYWGRRRHRQREATALSNNTVVIVNSGDAPAGAWRTGAGAAAAQSGPPSWCRHREYSSNNHRNGNDDDEDDYLIRQQQQQQQQPDGLWMDDDNDYRHEYYHYSTTTASSRKTPNYRCIGLVVSILVATVLLALSGIRTTWTLNAGESRRIETPILSRQITVSARSSINKDVLVYDLADCPPLTGPPVTLQDELSMTLKVDEYQYDYFFLNVGSSVNLTVHQSQGSSELYILEGANALRRLQTPSAADSDPFGKDAVVTGFASAGSNVSLRYKVGRSDVYTIVYDNPSSSESSVLQASYTALLTTYNLQGYAPICRDLQKDCHIHRPERGSCLLVQAPKRNKKKNPNDNLVTVKIRGQRRWLPILIYAMIPYLIGLLARKFCKPKSPYQMVHPNDEQQAVMASAPVAEDDDNNNEIEEANPPPTAPHAEQEIIATSMTPSAPPAEEDVPVVAQALTSVEVTGRDNNDNGGESVPMVQAHVMPAHNDKDWDKPSGVLHKLT